MSRLARDRSRSNTPRPLSSRVLEDDNNDKKFQIFKGLDNGPKKIYDINELKRLTVNIIRKASVKKGQEKQTVLFDPATVMPVRRPDEGKRPIFERKELLDWSSTSREKSEEKLREISPLRIKAKWKATSKSPSSDERNKKKENSPLWKPVSPVFSHIKIRIEHEGKEEDDNAKDKNNYHSKYCAESDSSKYKDKCEYEHRLERPFAGKYERKKDFSPERSKRRRSKESRNRHRSRTPCAYKQRYRRSKSRHSRRSRTRSCSYSYDRRTRSRSRSRSHDHRRSHSHERREDLERARMFLEEREYLKQLRQRMKERADKRLKERADKRLEEEMRLQEKKDKPQEKENIKKEVVKSGERSKVAVNLRPRPPRMRPPMMYPRVHHMFRPPVFQPFPSPYPPQRFYPPY